MPASQLRMEIAELAPSLSKIAEQKKDNAALDRKAPKKVTEHGDNGNDKWSDFRHGLENVSNRVKASPKVLHMKSSDIR
jgi:hypothetical protein